MKHKILFGLFFAAVLTVLMIEPAMASPGGKIVSAAFETFWGRIALFCLTILFLPLIIYNVFREKLAERRTRKDLRYMAAYSSAFEMLKVNERAKECFLRVHSGWQNEDLSEVTGWMTEWYWQNQQFVHLDNWKKQGLVNICNVKKINNIKPLLFVHRNHGAEHEDSMVVLSISAEMQDYLERKATGEIVEGSKKYKEVETVWSFTLEGGIWKVSDIDEASMAMAFAKMTKELPNIESTVVSDLRA